MSKSASLSADGGFHDAVVAAFRDLVQSHAHSLAFVAWPDLCRLALNSFDVDTALRVFTLKVCHERARAPHGKEATVSADLGVAFDGIPLEAWTALLRKQCRLRRLADAEQLFSFIASRIASTVDGPGSRQRRLDRCASSMLAMYAQLNDLDSACDLFVAATTEPFALPGDDAGAAALPVNASKYRFLLAAAAARDSEAHDVGHNLFLDACSDGVVFTSSDFQRLFQLDGRLTMGSLTREVVRTASASSEDDAPYPASPLDARVQVPASADAGLHRESVQLAREGGASAV